MLLLWNLLDYRSQSIGNQDASRVDDARLPTECPASDGKHSCSYSSNKLLLDYVAFGFMLTLLRRELQRRVGR